MVVVVGALVGGGGESGQPGRESGLDWSGGSNR